MDLDARIKEIKKKYGKRLLILAHHYQRDEIVRYADERGDSFQLAKLVSERSEAEFIVFCGVRFMVEAAAVLTKKHQRVLHPNEEAGCPLADSAKEHQILESWDEISNIIDTKSLIPVVYVNSDVPLKAFCGEHNGLTCTSSNAEKAFRWAFERGQRVLFFPDEHLGRNTAISMNFSEDEIAVWHPNKDSGGLTKQQITDAKVLLWKGHCHVHTWFTTGHIIEKRKEFPDAKIIVHPECKTEVVKAADGFGSTSYICNYVKNAPSGSTIVVGTEYNLVNRLASEYPDKRIEPLSESICPNMFKITIENLAQTLENLETMEPVQVPEKYVENTIIALNRMLSL